METQHGNIAFSKDIEALKEYDAPKTEEVKLYS